ncbi:MAG: hypothetical protein EB038_09860, partial [Cyclobacteriaceae bacterium]|nr:hypothetical protein [Cyclobacteriaceae bacterium]
MTQRMSLKGLVRLFGITVFLTLLTGLAVAQRSVSGKVIDADSKAPLSGVSIVVGGTTKGTSTDAQGNYKIDLGADQKSLVFSFNGYESRTLNVGSGATLNVELEVDVKALQSVVVTGYTSQRKK